MNQDALIRERRNRWADPVAGPGGRTRWPDPVAGPGGSDPVAGPGGRTRPSWGSTRLDTLPAPPMRSPPMRSPPMRST